MDNYKPAILRDWSDKISKKQGRGGGFDQVKLTDHFAENKLALK